MPVGIDDLACDVFRRYPLAGRSAIEGVVIRVAATFPHRANEGAD